MVMSLSSLSCIALVLASWSFARCRIAARPSGAVPSFPEKNSRSGRKSEDSCEERRPSRIGGRLGESCPATLASSRSFLAKYSSRMGLERGSRSLRLVVGVVGFLSLFFSAGSAGVERVRRAMGSHSGGLGPERGPEAARAGQN